MANTEPIGLSYARDLARLGETCTSPSSRRSACLRAARAAVLSCVALFVAVLVNEEGGLRPLLALRFPFCRLFVVMGRSMCERRRSGCHAWLYMQTRTGEAARGLSVDV
jgi:hypothetical protein